MDTLTHLPELKKVLTDYKISPASQAVLNKTKLVLLAAPTSSGRNVIIRELLKTNNYYYLVSDTTRSPRVNDGLLEKNGVVYWFRSEDEVLEDLQDGKFLEAAVIHNQQVSGISIRELQKASTQQKIAITDIEVVGVGNIVRAKPQTIAIFVLPPNFKEWQRRLKARGEMSDIEFQRRLESAVNEFKTALDNDYYIFVINDQLNHAVDTINAIALNGKIDHDQQEKARELAQQLYVSTKDYLEKLN